MGTAILADEEFIGRVVFLTTHMDHWLREANPGFNIPMVNRLAKVVKVFDWGSEEGKILIGLRKDNPKWGRLVSEDFKFVLNIYYPELLSKSGKLPGLTILEHVPRKYPGTELPLFDLYPERLLSDLLKGQGEFFKVLKKEIKESAKTDVPG